VVRPTQITIPTLVRLKDGALDRLGLYLRRGNHPRVAVMQSAGLVPALAERVRVSLRQNDVDAEYRDVADNDIESAIRAFAELPKDISAIVGVGGGKALDVAKYAAFLGRWPYYAVPTSLSNDGFCSPQSSLTLGGRRRSFPAALPYGVVVDTQVCREAPKALTLSGVGDLVAKFTAGVDWTLAFHAVGEPVNDFALLLSDGAVRSYLSRPTLDDEGTRLLATALLLNGTAMEICGSSRPASGSEHLVSHALDRISARPRLHGIQVGVAAYLMSLLQGRHRAEINELFERTGFWDMVAEDPLSSAELLEAVRLAPEIKPGYYTILSKHPIFPEVEHHLRHDDHLKLCVR
jgi:glycerol-1-phosphate dehydrogenase [NAD(P)+]